MASETSVLTTLRGEQAATEQDPVRLMELIEQINRLLKDKEERLAQRRSAA